MQLELLLYRFGQVPAEEYEGVAAMAFRMQESPGFLRRSVQNVFVKVDVEQGAVRLQWKV